MTCWEVDLEQEDLPARIDPSGEARLAALLCQASIPILDTPPEETWIWSDLHLADRSAFSWDRPFGDVADEPPPAPRGGTECDPATRSSAWATSPIRTLGAIDA